MTQKQDVLRMLNQARVDRRGVTNGEFADAGILRYSARIEELRKAGYRIAKQRLSAGGWRYTLLLDVERPIDHPVSGSPGSESLISSHRVDGPLSAEPESLFEVEAPRPHSPYEEAA